MKSGCIVVQETAVLPDSMQMGEQLFSHCWRIVNDVQGYGLDRAMHRIGWSFVYAAPLIKVSGVGFGLRHAIRAAFTRILNKAGKAKFNCVEIREFAARTFLGMTSVTIAAHPSNISHSRFR
jgi:hypothetical protein